MQSPHTLRAHGVDDGVGFVYEDGINMRGIGAYGYMVVGKIISHGYVNCAFKLWKNQ